MSARPLTTIFRNTSPRMWTARANRVTTMTGPADAVRSARLRRICGV